MSINVTKPYLPPLQEYIGYLEGIWERGWLTNNGPLVQQLETELSAALSGGLVQFMSNGTIALQVAIKALDLTGEIITTPFSYVATTTAILWEGCEPVFVDIEEQSFCIDATKIEAAITPRTSAILATHVYGYPCDVLAIEDIARRHNLKVIYDGAHAFGVTVHGRSLLTYGDITTCSFHATKLFHTSEGGAIITTSEELAKKVWLYKSFGHIGDEYFFLGVNGKNSEFHAAMGLCNLPRVPEFIAARRQVAELYQAELASLNLRYPVTPPATEYNYSYFPIILESEEQMQRVKDMLAAHDINTRRYFFPSLNKLPYHTGADCPVSEDISLRVLCLPFYQQLEHDEVRRISQLIRKALA
ncbi:dTDP-4-amino-4,6-dideoxygalactose transaminase [Hymenobacter gelipurpurascens]|uniref:dTDP-4-amino-4,6-dideoxygalactose transaminase n=1 Tax=Hymenobacter gelipurpurascens TaxID=89968 RepID=A0A212TPK2_9BACT|nr:DegT/DnrJ/EryC1/StrS family aminotransferase [Hymenobacter gelipurpurascens]SNC67751.1 dTDP-4-amino-4,6-dideoxygalactose transaminase [Hymenobacter gelipurpurascens]